MNTEIQVPRLTRALFILKNRLASFDYRRSSNGWIGVSPA